MNKPHPNALRESVALQLSCPYRAMQSCVGRDCAWWRTLEERQLPEPHAELVAGPTADDDPEGVCIGAPTVLNVNVIGLAQQGPSGLVGGPR